jgi:hypothetical protein
VAKVFLKYNFSAVADDVIIVWVKNTAPGAEIARYLLDDTVDHEKNGGHTVTGLDPVMHQFKFYQSSDGVALDTLLITMDIDASIYNEAIVERWNYVVDRGQSGSDPGEAWADPVDNANHVDDERLLGATHQDTVIEQRGYGQFRDDEISFTAIVAGGFQFLNGQKFSHEDTYFVTHYKIVAQQVQTVDSGSEYTDIKLLQDNVDQSIDFDSSFHSKICIANFTGSVGTIVFPALATIPDCKAKFSTHQGAQNYLTFAFNGSETVKVNGQSKGKVHIAKGKMVELIIKNNVAYLICDGTQFTMRGQIIGDYRNRSIDEPFLLADSSTGLLDGNQWPGLLEYVQSLPAGSVVTITNWNATLANKRKWGYNSITKEIRVPHLDDLHRRFRTGVEDAGTYQGDQVGQYTESTGDSEGGTDPINADTYAAGIYKMKNKVRNAGQETRVKAYKEYPLVVL